MRGKFVDNCHWRRFHPCGHELHVRSTLGCRNHNNPGATDSCRRPGKRGVVWLVIAALLQMHLMPMNFGGREAGATLVSVCTDHGELQVKLDAEGKAIPSSQADLGKSCPFCIAHSGYASPQAPDLAAPFTSLTARIAQLAPVVPARSESRFLIGRLSRAPPTGIA